LKSIQIFLLFIDPWSSYGVTLLHNLQRDALKDTHWTHTQHCRVLEFGRHALRSRGWREQDKVQPLAT